MKPHEEAVRKVVAEWLLKADADLALASHLLAEGSPDATPEEARDAVQLARKLRDAISKGLK
jgi:hypothetical protein